MVKRQLIGAWFKFCVEFFCSESEWVNIIAGDRHME